MLMSIPQCIILEIPTNSVNDSLYFWLSISGNSIEKLHCGNAYACMYLFQLCCEYYSNYIIVFWPEPNCWECKVNLLEYCGLSTYTCIYSSIPSSDSLKDSSFTVSCLVWMTHLCTYNRRIIPLLKIKFIFRVVILNNYNYYNPVVQFVFGW